LLEKAEHLQLELAYEAAVLELGKKDQNKISLTYCSKQLSPQTIEPGNSTQGKWSRIGLQKLHLGLVRTELGNFEPSNRNLANCARLLRCTLVMQ
jgi:hypothetical protein